MNTQSSSLTRFPEGSFGELFYISIPLVLSFLSGSLMMFLDRVILARFSLEAMNGVVAASNWAWAITVFGVGITSIAEVFVGQYNGSGQLEKVGRPVWQMLWFSLGIGLLFFPLAELLGPYCLPSDPLLYPSAEAYFKWILYFGVFFVAQAALNSFFVGIGKVKWVLITAIISNLVNFVLNLLFVFGLEGWLKPLGAKGAALATGLAFMLQFLILFLSFTGKAYRKTYGTTQWAFIPSECLRCLKVGLPNSIGRTIEAFAWSVIVSLLSQVSTSHLTLMSIGQSLYFLLFFCVEGLQKGVIAIASNLLGGKKHRLIPSLQKSAYRLVFLLALLFATPLILFPETILHLFHVEAMSPSKDLQITLIGVWIYFVLDCLTWTQAGLLTAAGDTRFVMLFNAFSAWMFAVVPVYLFFIHFEAAPLYTWLILDLYALSNVIAFYLRYRHGKWRQLHLLEA